MQTTAAPVEHRNIIPPKSQKQSKGARTCGLADKDELRNSFANKDALVLCGVVKGRIGRVIGVGDSIAYVCFDGRPESHPIHLHDAINV